jgi:ribosomal protein S18 acetylase RimI-like enzyme
MQHVQLNVSHKNCKSETCFWKNLNMIRHIKPHEEDEVRRLLAELSYEDQSFWTPRARPFREYVKKYRKVPVCERISGKNAILVSEQNGKLVGLCWCTVVDKGINRQGEIAEFYVEQEYRGRGIGEELIEAAKQFFIDEKAEVAFIWTHQKNKAAIRLYRKAGFKKVTQIVMALVRTRLSRRTSTTSA